jgi:hypothetical protein
MTTWVLYALQIHGMMRLLIFCRKAEHFRALEYNSLRNESDLVTGGNDIST